MFTPNLSPPEVNHIRSSLDRCSEEGIASELGRAKETVKRKINEIRENERIRKLSNHARLKKKS